MVVAALTLRYHASLASRVMRERFAGTASELEGEGSLLPQEDPSSPSRRAPWHSFWVGSSQGVRHNSDTSVLADMMLAAAVTERVWDVDLRGTAIFRCTRDGEPYPDDQEPTCFDHAAMHGNAAFGPSFVGTFFPT